MGQQVSCCSASVSESYQYLKNIRKERKRPQDKAPRSAGSGKTKPFEVGADVWDQAKPHQWVFDEVQFASHSYAVPPEVEKHNGPIAEGEQKLKENPNRYEGMKYPSISKSLRPEQQQYHLIRRTGSGFEVMPNQDGPWTYMQAKYVALKPPAEIDCQPDEYTDQMTYQSVRLPPARHPGRGQGLADVPHIKLIGEIHPDDISQGTVGDCWLLSAISALSEFDGAIMALFRNTPGVFDMPSPEFNKYVVTLYDMKTWQPVDIEVDERLAIKADGGGLLGCHPSMDGELWACYLEKAMAIHCGGWDQLDGGHCTHAWRMLVGCKEQYTFMNDGTGWDCLGKFNPNTGELEELANSPREGFQGLWPQEWPKVGGGGEILSKVGENEMFEKLCAWDDQNYIICCGSKAGSDTQATDGIVDGHAYTVLTCLNNVAGTDIDLLKVRNPWGKGEYTMGMWCDDGPGWKQYPQVAEVCKPVKANDGVFWVDKDEFFKYFKTIYMCAQDMSEFITSNRPSQ